MESEKVKCMVCGKEIEDEEQSILFCSSDCRRKWRPEGNDYSAHSNAMYEIHVYDIRAGEYGICYNGQQFGSAVGMCERFNEDIDGFYYWAVEVKRACFFTTCVDEKTVTCCKDGEFDFNGFPVNGCPESDECERIREINKNTQKQSTERKNEWLEYQWFFVNNVRELKESLTLVSGNTEIKLDARLILHLPTNKCILQFREHDFS